MPISLDTPAAQVDLGSPQFAALRKNLQANILKSHGRPHQRHVFLQFIGTAAVVKAWIKAQVASKVTTAEDQRQQSANPGVDGGLVTGFFLSATGYKKLGLAVGSFQSSAFRKGMKVEGAAKKDPVPGTWEEPYRGSVDAMVAFADANEAVVTAAAAALAGTVAGVASILTVESGRALKTADGVNREHFGYADGISQPLFDKADLPAANPANWDASAPLSLVLAADPFATTTADAFGSYFVYRKLGQQVGAFNDRVNTLATTLAMQPDLAGAMVVGRFKDGTPVVDSPVATGPTEANGFKFEDDGDKTRCPVHSHIRKVNPRKKILFVEVRKKRVARRGIPYGKPVFPIAGGGFQDPSLTAERGLLFMCFQRNIEDQFVFIQRTWADNPRFPLSLDHKVGDDPVIGQDIGEDQRWPKMWGDGSDERTKFKFESAVKLEGGEYFFAPSKVFLTSL
jgi:Dyp-type peroxidase family